MSSPRKSTIKGDPSKPARPGPSHDNIAKTAPRNPGQDQGHRRDAIRAKTSGRPATTQQNTLTDGGKTADGFVKSSQSPKIGAPTITIRITEGPANGVAAKGK